MSEATYELVRYPSGVSVLVRQEQDDAIGGQGRFWDPIGYFASEEDGMKALEEVSGHRPGRG